MGSDCISSWSLLIFLLFILKPFINSPEPKSHWWACSDRPPSSSLSVIHTLYTSPQKPLGQLKSNFIWSLHGMGAQMFVQMVQVTWPRCPPCPYMAKTLKNLLRNQKTDDLESWYSALDARVLPSLFKWWLSWPGPILQQGQIWSLVLLYGKRVKHGLFRNYYTLWYKSWYMQLT